MSVPSERILVRAPVGVVYATLTDVDGWPLWWRRCRTRRAPVTAAAHGGGDAEGDRHHLVLGGRWRGRTLHVRVHDWRHDVGMHLELRDPRGRPLGAVEWWLEPCAAGTLVHHLTHRGERSRQLHAYRRAVGDGLQDLKDHLELATAVAAGRIP